MSATETIAEVRSHQAFYGVPKNKISGKSIARVTCDDRRFVFHFVSGAYAVFAADVNSDGEPCITMSAEPLSADSLFAHGLISMDTLNGFNDENLANFREKQEKEEYQTDAVS